LNALATELTISGSLRFVRGFSPSMASSVRLRPADRIPQPAHSVSKYPVQLPSEFARLRF